MDSVKTYGLNASADRIYLYNPTFTSQTYFHEQSVMPKIGKTAYDSATGHYKDRKPFNLTVDGEVIRAKAYIVKSKMTMSKEMRVTKKLRTLSLEPYLFEPLFDLVANWVGFCYRAGNGNIAFKKADYETMRFDGTELSPFDVVRSIDDSSSRFTRGKVDRKYLFDIEGTEYTPRDLQRFHRQMRRVNNLPITTMIARSTESVPQAIETSELGFIREQKIYEPLLDFKPILDVQLENGESITITDFTTATATYSEFSTRAESYISDIEQRTHTHGIVPDNTFPLFVNEQHMIPEKLERKTLKIARFARINPETLFEQMINAAISTMKTQSCLSKITAKRAVLINPANFRRSDGLQFRGEQEQFMEKVSDIALDLKPSEGTQSIEECLDADFYLSPRLQFAYSGNLDVPIIGLPKRFGGMEKPNWR